MKFQPQLENLKSKIVNLKSRIEGGFESELNSFLPGEGGVELHGTAQLHQPMDCFFTGNDGNKFSDLGQAAVESNPAGNAVNEAFSDVSRPSARSPLIRYGSSKQATLVAEKNFESKTWNLKLFPEPFDLDSNPARAAVTLRFFAINPPLSLTLALLLRCLLLSSLLIFSLVLYSPVYLPLYLPYYLIT